MSDIKAKTTKTIKNGEATIAFAEAGISATASEESKRAIDKAYFAIRELQWEGLDVKPIKAKAVSRPTAGDSYDESKGIKAASLKAEEKALRCLEWELRKAVDLLAKAKKDVGTLLYQCGKKEAEIDEERKKL